VVGLSGFAALAVAAACSASGESRPGYEEFNPERSGDTGAPTPAPTPITVPVPVQPKDAGPEDTGAPEDAGPPDSGPVSTTTCQAPRELGSLAGDNGAPVLSAQGDCNDWIRVRALETQSGAVGTQMKAKLVLTSPAGANFDMFVYVDIPVDKVECSTSTFNSQEPTGRDDSVSLAWGEGTVANGEDDSRTISINVRNKGASCDPALKWKLSVLGNQ